MRMDLAGERFQVEAGYEVQLPHGDHLIIVAGAHLGEPAHYFDHPNIVAKRSKVFEFKHYRKGGSKFWTSKAGISFYFVIPKAQIELLPEKGYSYVPVLIHGLKCRLNVSGGTGNSGWTDRVDQVVHVGCGWTLAALRSLAAIALSPNECQAQGITLEIKGVDDRERQGFVETAAAVVTRKSLQRGSQVLLRKGWDHHGSQGPFEVQSRPHRKRYFVCQGVCMGVRVPYSAIDWGRTTEINGVAVPGPLFVNRIGPVLEPTPV